MNSKKKILIVEDDDISRDVIKMFIKTHYDYDTAPNAESALELISKNRFDAFLLDINLGRGMNGTQLMQRIKQMDTYDKTPVIAMTAFVMDGDQEEFLSAGFDYYLPKPFSKNLLLELLKNSITE